MLGVGGILDGDDVGAVLAAAGQDAPRRGQHAPAFRRFLGNHRQGQGLALAGQGFRIAQDELKPFDRFDDLAGADAAILVEVEDIEGLGVEFHARHRAGQRHPKLHVEFVECQDVGAGLDPDLIESARPQEPPYMCRQGAALPLLQFDL